MTMQTVYDKQGKAHTVEPVDAREYVASGHYFREPPEVAVVGVELLRPPLIDPLDLFAPKATKTRAVKVKAEPSADNLEDVNSVVNQDAAASTEAAADSTEAAADSTEAASDSANADPASQAPDSQIV